MDLKAVLAANKAKASKITATPKPIAIADQDRPYSEAELAPIPSSLIVASVPPSDDTHFFDAKNGESKQEIIEAQITPSPIEINVPDITPVVTDKKPTTKWQQTDNKVATKPTTNRKQTDNKPTTKPQQLVNNSFIKSQNWQQSGNATGNKTGNKVATKRKQSGNKVATIMPFSKLVGLQREIVIFICHECKNSRSRITEAVTLEYMENSLKHRANVIKTTIQRLEKKGCLIRVEFKNGRGGWSRYEVPDSIYHDVIRSETGNKLTTNWQQTDNKVASQPATEPTTSASSSSSVNIKETTTTGINEEWNFDVTPYIRFGFTSSQLKQLASLNVISAADVEQSLIEFSFDLDNNALPHIKTTKINFLMGLLRTGHSYVSEVFKNEQEAMIAKMAKRAEDKRKKMMEEKFVAWEAGLSDEERKYIEKALPISLMALHRTYGISHQEVRKWIFNYYLTLAK